MPVEERRGVPGWAEGLERVDFGAVALVAAQGMAVGGPPILTLATVAGMHTAAGAGMVLVTAVLAMTALAMVVPAAVVAALLVALALALAAVAAVAAGGMPIG